MHGVFGLRITLGRPFPGSLPVVLPTSSPSPLRNSPGFPPGSPRPHRGRTMHATQISTCDTHFATRRPPAPCHRHAGSRAAHASEPTERDRRGTSHPRGNSVRQGTSCHARWQASRSLTDLPQTQTNHAPPQTGSPHRAGNPLRLSLTLQTRLRKLQCESQCGLQSAVPQRADTDRHSKAITTKSCTPTHTSCPKYNFTNTKVSTRLLAGSAAKPMRNGPKSHTWAPNPGRDHNFPVKKLWASPTTRRYAPAFRNIRTSPRHVATRHFTPAW